MPHTTKHTEKQTDPGDLLINSETLSHPLQSCSILMLDSKSKAFFPFRIRKTMGSYHVKCEH